MVLAVGGEERVVLDDWEAGELSVEYDDNEPQEVIEWALNAFSRERVAICTSFQTDGMAILDMAWRIRPDVRVFTVDTGRLPQETYELIDRVNEARIGTMVGLGGSAVVLAIGLWLMSRRARALCFFISLPVRAAVSLIPIPAADR